MSETKETTYAIIPAGGIGKRMQSQKPKQFIGINDQPILIITLKTLAATGLIDKFIIPTVDLVYTKKIIKSYVPDLNVVICKNGKTRQDSVYNGIQEIKADPQAPDFILIHDAVRPLIKKEIITEVINKAKVNGGAIAARPVTDTLKLAFTKDHDFCVKKNVSREMLWQAQTPQVYRAEIIIEAYEKAKEDHFEGTDSAGLVERLNKIDIVMVNSPQSNIKITTEEDLEFAKLYLSI